MPAPISESLRAVLLLCHFIVTSEPLISSGTHGSDIGLGLHAKFSDICKMRIEQPLVPAVMQMKWRIEQITWLLLGAHPPKQARYRNHGESKVS
ncbi:MAG: hypothetical protein QM775_10525 [Pirellulales bacterium]